MIAPRSILPSAVAAASRRSFRTRRALLSIRPATSPRVTTSRPLALFSFTWLLIAFAALPLLRAAKTLPPPPRDHFTDTASLVRPETARQLNAELAQFERDTSSQLLVAIFPKMQSDSSVEDYTVRLAQSWRVGGKSRDNGAVLFVFKESRDVRIQTGYGLEAVLPDALCKQIIENEIVPRFRAGDFDAGVAAGARALMAAARGEYRGTGRTAADSDGSASEGSSGALIFLIIFALIFFSGLRSASRRQTVYGPRGGRTVWIDRGGRRGGLGGFGGGGGWGGGSSGGGGGTFSGGGGSFGGGGAGGKW